MNESNESGTESVEEKDLILSSLEGKKLEKFLRDNPEIGRKFYIKIERILGKKTLQGKLSVERAQGVMDVVKLLKNLFS